MSNPSRLHRESEQLPPRLADVLLASLTALAAADQSETACRLAGQACAALRENSPLAWRRFNAFLHRFAGETPALGSSNDLCSAE